VRMDSHTISALNRLEVVETGRRRRWSEEEKARIVLESMSEPRLVAATARRYGLSRSLLVTWRRDLVANRAKSEAGFVRAVVAEDRPVPSAALSSRSAPALSTEQRIEVELTSGRRVIVDAGVRVARVKTGGYPEDLAPTAVEALRKLAGYWPDKELAVSLNRMRCKTGDDKSWTTVRVREMRERLGLPEYDPA